MKRAAAIALLALGMCACSAQRRDRAETGAVEDIDVVVPEAAARCVAPTSLRCGEACVDPNTDPMHCGRCPVACGPTEMGARGTGVCTMGVCSITCPPGFADCDGMPANGCEVELGTNAQHCGRCGRVCDAQPFSALSCVAGECALSCDGEHGDCDGVYSGGCETLFAVNIEHCGACGTRCPRPPRTNPSCSMGRCSAPCRSGYLDCDGNAANGCESSRLDPRNCGACGNACAGEDRLCAESSMSVGGARCVSSCPAETVECNGVCSRLDRDPEHCGGCLVRCLDAPNANASCRSGACGFTCRPDYGDCDGAADTGCEVSLATDARNCGRCGNACADGQRCVEGVCMAGGGAGADAGADASVDAGDDCATLSRYAYVLTSAGQIYRFDPATMFFESLGPVRCAGVEPADVRGMTVDALGFAWVIAAGGRVYKVDLRTMRCAVTEFDRALIDNAQCGVGFAPEQSDPRVGASIYLTPRAGTALYRVAPDTLATARVGEVRLAASLMGGCPADAGAPDAAVEAGGSPDGASADAVDTDASADSEARIPDAGSIEDADAASVDALADASSSDSPADGSLDASLLDASSMDASADARPLDVLVDSARDASPTVATVALGPAGFCLPTPATLELAGASDGRLYALIRGTSPMQLVEVARDSALASRGWRVPGRVGGSAAVAALGTSFLVFASEPTTGSEILRVDPSTGRTTPVVSDLGFTVIGAGTVACRRP